MSQNGTAKLIGLGDPVKDKEIPCTGMIKIGRDEKVNSISVKHASVSRQHAQIFQDAEVWVVEDMKSTNGVFINDNKISTKAPLKNGDVVRIGDIPFKFELFQEGGQPHATQVITKNEPAPKAAAPAPRPAPAPSAAADKSDAGGEDLFEPSIVGGTDMGAAIRAAQAAGSAKPAPPPPPEEGAFEGTMYGPQVARQLVKAIREEKEHKEHEAAAKGSPAARAAAGPNVPNMFMLKMKAIIIAVIVLVAVGFGVVSIFKNQEKAKESMKIVNESKGKLEAFVDEYENRVPPTDGPELSRTLQDELLKLAEVDKIVKAAPPKLDQQPEYLAKIQSYQDKLNFLIFERNFKQAIIEQNKAKGESLIAEMEKSATPDQKAIVPFAKLMLKYQLFHRANMTEPKVAEQPPANKDVEELNAVHTELENEYRDRSKYLQVEGKRFYLNAKEVVDNDLPAMLAWFRFWLEFKDYENTKTDAEKTIKAESLKKAYPNMKMVQALK